MLAAQVSICSSAMAEEPLCMFVTLRAKVTQPQPSSELRPMTSFHEACDKSRTQPCNPSEVAEALLPPEDIQRAREVAFTSSLYL